jgi:hypothetical protein
MPGDEVGIGTPIGFFSVEASSYLWIRFFAGAKIDVRAFDWFDISKLLTACIYEAGETDQQRRDCLVEKISHGVLPSVSCCTVRDDKICFVIRAKRENFFGVLE